MDSKTLGLLTTPIAQFIQVSKLENEFQRDTL